MYKLKKKKMTLSLIKKIEYRARGEQFGTNIPVKCLKRRRICVLCFHTVPQNYIISAVLSKQT